MNILHRARRRNRTRGFTLVELLIVIVVIAILAAISVVAYNGVQQRANNSAIIHAANSTMRLVQAYIASEGTYPAAGTTVVFCVTTDSGCREAETVRPANSYFETSIVEVGDPPRSVPIAGDNRYGVLATYWAGNTFLVDNGSFYVTYWLQGVGQQCGIGPVLNSGVNGYATAGYTVSNSGGSGKTQCTVHIPGPAHS